MTGDAGPQQLRETMNRKSILLTTAILSAVSLAGCTATGAPVRDITFWVEPMDWEIAPGVTTPVWAFCAEGDGVEPMWDGPCGVPGPTIHVNAGDTVRVTFRNTHAIPHTVHFHGRHPFAADMNGNGAISDAMVVAGGEDLTIEWTADPLGSFIYHCHFDTPTHMEMGMYGAFIVHKPGPRDGIDYVAVLDEWRIGTADSGGAIPDYDYFTINGKSFPLTPPILADPGERVRIHMVNAGYEFHAMHLHGYTPLAYEGVAGPEGGFLTDVREIAPGQTVVMEFTAREGIWLFHDHVVPSVTAGGSWSNYPRGMLTVMAVGDEYQAALLDLAPSLVEAARGDSKPGERSDLHADHDHAHDAAQDNQRTDDEASTGEPAETEVPRLASTIKDFAFDDLTIAPGTRVTWTNQDMAVHTVTDGDGAFDSGDMKQGESWSYTFDAPGTYQVYCKPHAYQQDGEWKGMVATVTVQ